MNDDDVFPKCKDSYNFCPNIYIYFF